MRGWGRNDEGHWRLRVHPRVRLYTFADETKKRGKQKRQDNANEDEAAPVQTLSPRSNAICQKRGDHFHNDTDDEKSTPAEAEVGDQSVKAETLPVQGVFALFTPVLQPDVLFPIQNVGEGAVVRGRSSTVVAEALGVVGVRFVR